MIQIKRIKGFNLNPNDKVVNSILKRCEENDGLCPCHHTSEDYEGKDLHCPCTDYTIHNKCVCTLYVPNNPNLESNYQTIILHNRYGVKNKLEKIDNHKYKLVFENPQERDWCRFGLKEGTDWLDNSYYFVDPSGGPFLQIGNKLADNLLINEIATEDKDIIIYTKNEKDN